MKQNNLQLMRNSGALDYSMCCQISLASRAAAKSNARFRVPWSKD